MNSLVPSLFGLLGLLALELQVTQVAHQDAGSGDSGTPAEGAAPTGSGAGTDAGPDAGPGGVPLLAGEALVHWGEERRIYFPRAETLKFRAKIKWGLSAPVGTVTMTTAMEPHGQSLILLAQPEDGDEGAMRASMRAVAQGDYKLYSLDATIESRVFPDEWPEVVYNYISQGSERRRREILIGKQEGQPYSRYRGDTKVGAPKGTRIWADPVDRTLPEPGLDMLTSVYYARTMIRENLVNLRFPLVDKYRLWDLNLRRGERALVDTRAGTFEAVEILLQPRPYPGEVIEEEKQEKFEGLFGIQGSIRLWVEVNTGIPVLVQGDVPVGPIDLGVHIELMEYSGTPPGFAPR